jgi:hypothetical protein
MLHLSSPHRERLSPFLVRSAHRAAVRVRVLERSRLQAALEEGRGRLELELIAGQL